MRMSDSEALMWAVEKDPALRCDFCNLTIVDGPIDRRRMRATVERAVRAIPRLSQRVVEPSVPVATPDWVDETDLDIDDHIRWVELGGNGDMRALLDACEALSEPAFDRSKPLWEFIVVEGLDGDRTALLQRLHHTITDGVGGLKLSLEIVDIDADGRGADTAAATSDAADDQDARDGVDGDSAEDPRPSIVASARSFITDSASRGLEASGAVIGGARRAITDPLAAPRRVAGAWSLAGSLRRQLLVLDGAKSDVMDDRSLHRHFEVRTYSMPDAIKAAKNLGGSVNDVFVTALASALGAYHAELGSHTTELRMAMAVNTRGRGDQAANRFSPTRVIVPIGPIAERDRFAEIHRRLDTTKREPAVVATESIASLVSTLPAPFLVALARSQARTIDFATSNLRGSPIPLYLAGRRIVGNYALGPRVGCALNVTLMSFCDDMHVGLNIDPAAICDIPTFAAKLDTAFTTLLAPEVAYAS
ncbi:MAG TPA: wax ester/triacylglycerol synthase domain-containing protein [Acidimicrobiia bacterium]